MIPALLLFVVAVNFLPEYVAAVLGHSIKAWEYVAAGIEAGALWSAVGYKLRRYGWASWAICGYGAFEGFSRAACRLAFPMNKAPTIEQPIGLCAAAGFDTYSLAPFLIALCAFVLSRCKH